VPTHQHRRVALVRLARHVTERPRARGHLARLCIRSAARRRSPSRRNCYARHRQSITRRPAGGPPWPARRTAPPHPRVRARTTAAHCIGSTRADSLRFCQNFQNQWVALGRRGRRACPRLQSLSPRASPASCTGSSQVRQQAHWSAPRRRRHPGPGAGQARRPAGGSRGRSVASSFIDDVPRRGLAPQGRQPPRSVRGGEVKVVYGPARGRAPRRAVTRPHKQQRSALVGPAHTRASAHAGRGASPRSLGGDRSLSVSSSDARSCTTAPEV